MTKEEVTIIKAINGGIDMKIILRILLMIAIGLVFGSKIVSAAAPLKIDLSYDQEKETLHIDVTHHSHNQNEHFIKKIIIKKNSEAPVTLYFRLQVDHVHFITDAPLKAQPGDVIEVEATDNKGGSKSETLVVPEVEEEQPKASGNHDAKK